MTPVGMISAAIREEARASAIPHQMSIASPRRAPFSPAGTAHSPQKTEPKRTVFQTPDPPMKTTSVLLLTATLLATTIRLHAQVQSPSPAAGATPVAYEPLPTLDASVILQPQYFHGPNFTVRKPVPTYFGSNRYTIDSDFGV